MNQLPADIPVWALLILGFVPAVIAWINTRRSRGDIAAIREHNTEVREQVTNNHSTNLRDDMDRTHAAVENLEAIVRDGLSRLEQGQRRQIEDTNEVRRDISGIRSDIGELRGQDRRAREEFEDFRRGVVDFARRNHPGESL